MECTITTEKSNLKTVNSNPKQCGIFSWGLYYKTLQICNARKLDIFRSKLVFYIVGQKHTYFEKHNRLLTHNVYIVEAPGFCMIFILSRVFLCRLP
jgi:hypothetical protein